MYYLGEIVFLIKIIIMKDFLMGIYVFVYVWYFRILCIDLVEVVFCLKC